MGQTVPFSDPMGKQHRSIYLLATPSFEAPNGTSVDDSVMGGCVFDQDSKEEFTPTSEKTSLLSDQ